MRGWLRAGGEPRVGPRAECGPDRLLLPRCLRRTLHAPNAFEKRRVRADCNLRGRQISIDAFASGGFGTGFVSPPRVTSTACATSATDPAGGPPPAWSPPLRADSASLRAAAVQPPLAPLPEGRTCRSCSLERAAAPGLAPSHAAAGADARHAKDLSPQRSEATLLAEVEFELDRIFGQREGTNMPHHPGRSRQLFSFGGTRTAVAEQQPALPAGEGVLTPPTLLVGTHCAQQLPARPHELDGIYASPTFEGEFLNWSAVAGADTPVALTPGSDGGRDGGRDGGWGCG